MDNECSTNPFANGASEEVTCQKGGLLLDLGSGNDGNSYKQNGKKTPELFFLGRPSNGKVTEDDDLGPETDVDAVDDIQLSPCKTNPFNVDEELREQLLDFEPMKEPRQETPTPPADEVSGVVGLVPDNAAESGEESEDEWNYYKVEPSGNKTEPEPKQQTNLPVCEKPASLQEITVPSESADMESQLNPNAAEFIPSPTQQRSMEQFLQTESGVEVDAELLTPITSKTQEGISKDPSECDSSGPVSPSEKLPDLLNGQKNEYLSCDAYQLEDARVDTSASVLEGSEITEFPEKLATLSGLGNVSDGEILGALSDQISLQEKCDSDLSSNSPTTFGDDFLPKADQESTGFDEFLDNNAHGTETAPLSVQHKDDSTTLSPVQKELEPLFGTETVDLSESDPLKEVNAEFEQMPELTNNIPVEVNEAISPNPVNVEGDTSTSHDISVEQDNPHINPLSVEEDISPIHPASVEGDIFGHGTAVLTAHITEDSSHPLSDMSSFPQGNESGQGIHISFELHKDIAPEMESQPELVKLNGEDNSLSFDIQESVLEEEINEIGGSIGTDPETPVDLDYNQFSVFHDDLKGRSEIGYMPLLDTTEPMLKQDIDHTGLLDMTAEVEKALSGMYSPSNESPEKQFGPTLNQPSSVCKLPLENVNDLKCDLDLSFETKEADLLQKDDITTFTPDHDNLNLQEMDLKSSEITPSLDLLQDSVKPELQSPSGTMTPPPTPALPLDPEVCLPNVQTAVDVIEKLPEINKDVDSVEREEISTEGENVTAATAVVAAAATAAVTAAVAATAATDVTAGTDVALKDAEPKKAAVKKQIPEKSKLASKTPARSKLVPSKTIKSVPTSPTKPVQKSLVKKLPASAPPKPAKVLGSALGTTGTNKPKTNGLTPKPASGIPPKTASGLTKSRPPSGTSSGINDVSKPLSKRVETVGNKLNSVTLPASKTRPVTAPTPSKTLSKPPVSKTAPLLSRPNTASTNGSVAKPKVPLTQSRPKPVAQTTKVTSVKEGKESVNKQISSSRITSAKPPTASLVSRTVTQSSTARKVESKSVGSVSVTKTTTTTLKTATSKLGAKKSPSVTSSSSAKSKVAASSENRESVKEVTSSVIGNNDIKCDQALFGNAE